MPKTGASNRTGEGASENGKSRGSGGTPQRRPRRGIDGREWAPAIRLPDTYRILKIHATTEADQKRGRADLYDPLRAMPEIGRHEPTRARSEGPMSRGQLYEWYKRQGLLAVYFMLYPQG